MNIKDKDRIYSFLKAVAGPDLELSCFWARIDNCKLPGEYVAELVSVSLGAGKLKSASIYFIEPSGLEQGARTEQRNKVCAYYSNLLSSNDRLECLFPNDTPMRIDPSFKSSDSADTERFEIIADYPEDGAVHNAIDVVNYLFPETSHKIVGAMLNWHTLGRIAIEADVQRKAGKKVRLYSYDGCGVTGLMCRGVSIRHNGELSTDKKYYGVYGDVDAARKDIEGMVSPSFFARVCSNDELFRSYNMSFRYMASEVSDYGVDAKFYFRNEGDR